LIVGAGFKPALNDGKWGGKMGNGRKSSGRKAAAVPRKIAAPGKIAAVPRKMGSDHDFPLENRGLTPFFREPAVMGLKKNRHFREQAVTGLKKNRHFREQAVMGLEKNRHFREPAVMGLKEPTSWTA
jgi:hypothetical protein